MDEGIDKQAGESGAEVSGQLDARAEKGEMAVQHARVQGRSAGPAAVQRAGAQGQQARSRAAQSSFKSGF